MNNHEIHICSKSILTFLLDETKTSNYNELESLNNMNNTLLKYTGNQSMVNFTEYIIEKYKLDENIKDIDNTYRGWFRTKKSIDLYRYIIQKTSRKQKLNHILLNT